MFKDQLLQQTKQIVLDVFHLIPKIPKNEIGRPIINQVVRSASSVGANYRAACRAKSTSDFISKLKIVEEELDEIIYWLELFVESGLVSSALVNDLKFRASKCLGIIVASIKTSKQRLSPHK